MVRAWKYVHVPIHNEALADLHSVQPGVEASASARMQPHLVPFAEQLKHLDLPPGLKGQKQHIDAGGRFPEHRASSAGDYCPYPWSLQNGSLSVCQTILGCIRSTRGLLELGLFDLASFPPCKGPTSTRHPTLTLTRVTACSWHHTFGRRADTEDC